MSRGSKIVICCLFLFALVLADDNYVCDSGAVEDVFKQLNFVNNYQEELKEGIFWESTNPIKISDDLEIIYFSKPTANLLGLNFEEVLSDLTCQQTFAEYLSGIRKIPGSQPVSLPQTKW